ncbi:MAG: glycosyltransferase family 4 protein [Candidatus Aminicenantaceae bacterium]
MKALNICIISPNYPPSDFTCGVGDYTNKTAVEFEKMGHRITILASERYKGPLDSGNIRVIRFSKNWSFSAIFRLISLIKKNRFDLINVQYTPVLYKSAFKLLLGFINIIKPIVISFHTLHRSTISSKIESLLLVFTCRGIISTNEEITYILKRLPFTKKRFSEIPIGSNIMPANGENISKLEAKNELGLSETYFIMTNFGLFYPGKGIETLLNACSLLKEKITDFQLIFLGSLRQEDTDYIRKLKNLINKLNVQDKVVFTGFLESKKVTQYLMATDLFVVPFDRGVSIRRGSLIAGIIHGLPILTTLPEIPSKYINEQNMALVPPKDPLSLMNKIIELKNNTAKMIELEENVSKLRQNFMWPDISKKIIKEFYRLLEINS